MKRKMFFCLLLLVLELFFLGVISVSASTALKSGVWAYGETNRDIKMEYTFTMPGNGTIVYEVHPYAGYFMLDGVKKVTNSYWVYSSMTAGDTTYVNGARAYYANNGYKSSEYQFKKGTQVKISVFDGSANYQSLFKVRITYTRAVEPITTVTSWNGHRYQLIDDGNGCTWTEAKEACERLGGHLVTITSKEEHEFLKTLMGGLINRYCWIGGSKVSGKWTWVTGETWSYTCWSADQPNGSGGGGYALMQNYTGYTTPWFWDDQNNTGTSPSSKWNSPPYSQRTSSYFYICEWDEEAVRYTLTFNANGGSVSKPSISAKKGSKWGTLPTPTRSGYTFSGWYTAASGGTKVTASSKASANLTVYAHWKAQTFSLTGYVKDAATGKNLSKATVSARSGYNNKTGTVVKKTTSGSSGKFTLNLPKGRYTISTQKSGYTTNYFNLDISKNVVQNPVITDKITSSQYRVVLTWGKTPADLDAHLTGPGTSGRFHIFWNSKKTSYSSKVLAVLDVDDRSSYGPETITINYGVRPSGIYRYYVHNYSNRSSKASSALGNSGAMVTVYRGNSQIANYTVPKKAGTLWYVFYIRGGKVTKVNSIGYSTNIS